MSVGYKIKWYFSSVDNILILKFEVKDSKKKYPSVLPFNQETLERVYRNYSAFYFERFSVKYGDINISYNINSKELLDEFIKYYSKYSKIALATRDKYYKKFKYISNIHRKVIKEDKYTESIIENYIYGTLVGLDMGEDIDITLIKRNEVSKKNVKKHITIDFDISVNDIKNIMKLIKNIKSYSKPFRVFRGINLKKELKIGDEIIQRLPFSTSLNPYVSRDFVLGNCCFLDIDVPANYKALFLSDVTKHEEQLVLFPSILTIKNILKIKKKNLYKYLNDQEFPFIREANVLSDKYYYSSDLTILKCSIEEAKIKITNEKIILVNKKHT